MLTGRRPFGGEDTSATLASVLRDEPDWQAAAARPRRRSRACCADCSKRIRRGGCGDMGDVKLLMTDAEAHVGRPVSVAPRSRRWWIVGAAVLGIAAGLVSAAVVVSWRRGATPVVASRTVPAPVSCDAAFDRTSGQERRDVSRRHAHRVHVRRAASQSAGRAAHRSAGRHGHRERRPWQGSILLGRRPAGRLRDARRAETRVGGRRRRASGSCDLSRSCSGAGAGAPDGSIVFAQGGGLGLFRVPESRRRTAAHRGAGRVEGRTAITSVPWCFRMAARCLDTVALRGGRTRIVARRFAGGDPITVVEPGFGAVYLASGHLSYSRRSAPDGSGIRSGRTPEDRFSRCRYRRRSRSSR